MEGNSSVLASVIIGVVVIGSIASYGIYTTNSSLSGLSEQNSSLRGQMTGLNQQVSNLNQQVSVLQQRTVQVVTIVNTVEVVDLTTTTTTSTVTSVSAVPISTLVMINSSYSSITKTFLFQMQNTQTFTVYAQLSAQIGVGGCGNNGNHQAYFVSPVYAFGSLQRTVVPLNTTLIPSTTTCGSSLILGQVNLSFVAGNNMLVSQTYTFHYNLTDCNISHAFLC